MTAAIRHRQRRRRGGAAFAEALIVAVPMMLLWGGVLYLGELYSKEIALAQRTRECVFERTTSFACDLDAPDCLLGEAGDLPESENDSDLDDALARLTEPGGGLPFLQDHLAAPYFPTTWRGGKSGQSRRNRMFGTADVPYSFDSSGVCNQTVAGRKWQHLSECETRTGEEGQGDPALCDDAWYTFVEVAYEMNTRWELDDCVAAQDEGRECTSSVADLCGFEDDMTPSGFATNTSATECYAGTVARRPLR